MILYFIIVSFVCLCSVGDIVKTSDLSKRYMLLSVLIVLVLFAGTRFETGNDWVEYTKVFENVPLLSELKENWEVLFLYRMEPGYILFNSVIKSIGGTLDFVFFISCIVSVGIFFSTVKNYTICPLIAMLLYMRYGYLQINTMFVRQGIAIAFFFYSLKFIGRNYCLYFFINLLASMFHYSVLIVLPLYFVINKRFSNFFLVSLVLFSFALSFFDWTDIIIKTVPFFSQVIINYTASEVWGGMTGQMNVAVIEKGLIFAACIFLRKKIELKHKSFNLFFNLFVLSVVCYFSFFQIYVFQQRLSMIFQLSTVFVILYILSIMSLKSKRILLLLLNFVVMYFFLNYINASSDVYVPYKSWLI